LPRSSPFAFSPSPNSPQQPVQTEEEMIWQMNLYSNERDRILVRNIFKCVEVYLRNKKNQPMFQKLFSFNQKNSTDLKWLFQFFVLYHLRVASASHHVVSEFVAYYIMNQLCILEISELVSDVPEFMQRVFYYSSKFLTSRNTTLKDTTKKFWKKIIGARESYLKKILYMPPKNVLARDSTFAFKIILLDALPDMVSIWPTDERAQKNERNEEFNSAIRGKTKPQLWKVLFNSTLTSVVCIFNIPPSGPANIKKRKREGRRDDSAGQKTKLHTDKNSEIAKKNPNRFSHVPPPPSFQKK
jgi:hypothetical protein